MEGANQSKPLVLVPHEAPEGRFQMVLKPKKSAERVPNRASASKAPSTTDFLEIPISDLRSD